jgi:hypothetical protein
MKLIPTLGTALGLGLAVAAPAANAADWSIGIGIGVPGAIVVAPDPVYVAPPPRYYVPRVPPGYVVSPGYYGPYGPAPCTYRLKVGIVTATGTGAGIATIITTTTMRIESGITVRGSGTS